MKITSTEREEKIGKKISGFGDIYGQGNKFYDKKGIIRWQHYITDDYIWLGVPILQEIPYKQCYLNIKLNTRFVDTIQVHCVDNTQKVENFIFDILKHIMVYNIIQVGNDDIYISLCWVYGCKTTENYLFSTVIIILWETTLRRFTVKLWLIIESILYSFLLKNRIIGQFRNLKKQ